MGQNKKKKKQEELKQKRKQQSGRDDNRNLPRDNLLDFDPLGGPAGQDKLRELLDRTIGPVVPKPELPPLTEMTPETAEQAQTRRLKEQADKAREIDLGEDTGNSPLLKLESMYYNRGISTTREFIALKTDLYSDGAEISPAMIELVEDTNTDDIDGRHFTALGLEVLEPLMYQLHKIAEQYREVLDPDSTCAPLDLPEERTTDQQEILEWLLESGVERALQDSFDYYGILPVEFVGEEDRKEFIAKVAPQILGKHAHRPDVVGCCSTG